MDENIRYDLVPNLGLQEVCKILNTKLEKHERNEWKYGLSWTEVLSSLKKHLSEFELGHDFTKNNLLNIAYVAEEALILAEYYKIFPQGDDRVVVPCTSPIVCCDLDDVVFKFVETYEQRFNTKISEYWSGDYNMEENLKILQNEKDFWVNMPIKAYPPFEVDYYVTSRSIPLEWTKESIQKNNLPKAPIISLPWNVSKIETLKDVKCDIMIDDKINTFKECKNAGIFCYLVTTPANKRYNVGHHRINSIEELTYIK